MRGVTQERRPTMSLIIPAYNEEEYLPACLDAVMANVAGKAVEIIVVDNNSTDGTKAVIERYPARDLCVRGRKRASPGRASAAS